MLVDDRVGSADLAAPLASMGLTVDIVRLDAGDVAFEGRGEGDRPVQIGVELKKLTSGDFVSSLLTNRLNDQGAKMLGPDGYYDYGWLVIEGRYRVNKRGQVLVQKRPRFAREWTAVPGLLASSMEKRILTLELCGGFHVRFTDDRRATLHFLANLVRWWSDKALDRHGSHLADHERHGFLPLSDFRTVVKRFPHVGLKLSAAVETHFGGSLRRAVNAQVDDWAKIVTVDAKGRSRRLGVPTAEKIVSFCRGEA